jgi:hypothetical protein
MNKFKNKTHRQGKKIHVSETKSVAETIFVVDV